MNERIGRAVVWASAAITIASLIYVINAVFNPIIKPLLEILLPFCIALAIALALDSAIIQLQRRGLSRASAVTCVAAVFIAAIACFFIFVVPVLVGQAVDLADNSPRYFAQIQTALAQTLESNQQILQRFNLPSTTQEVLNEISKEIPSLTSGFFKGLGRFLTEVASKAIWVILIPIITLFLVADIGTLKQRSLLLVPAKNREQTAEIAASIGRVFGAYVRGLVTVAVIFGLLCGIVLWIWGVPYAAILGAAATVLSLVPYIGVFSTIVISTLVELVHQLSVNGGNPINALWVALSIIGINQLTDNLISPRVVGRAVGLHPAISILSLLIGGKLFGLAGMVLAVPIAASIRIIILEIRPDLKPPEEKHPEPFLRRLLLRKRHRNKKTNNPAAKT